MISSFLDLSVSRPEGRLLPSKGCNAHAISVVAVSVAVTASVLVALLSAILASVPTAVLAAILAANPATIVPAVLSPILSVRAARTLIVRTPVTAVAHRHLADLAGNRARADTREGTVVA